MDNLNQSLISTPAAELSLAKDPTHPTKSSLGASFKMAPNLRSIVNLGIVDASTYSLPNNCISIPQHVLITGLGRGGTTALAKIFEALGITFKDATVTLENHSYRRLYQLGRTDELLQIFDYSEHAVRSAWKEPKLRSVAGIELLKFYPPVVGVAVIFRDVLATSIRNVITMDWELFNALDKAASETRKLVTFANSVKDRPLLLISYEKLLLETVEVVKEIANWIGVTDTEKIALAVLAVEPNSVAYLEASLKSRNKSFE